MGLEPSAEGRALAEQLAALEPGLTLVSAPGSDAGFDPALGGTRTLFVTSFSMMFAPTVEPELFRTIARIPGDVVCLFIEPFGFQLGGDDPRARLQAEAAARMGLNTNFFATFQQAVREGLLEPAFIGRDLFGTEGEPLTQASVIVAAKV